MRIARNFGLLLIAAAGVPAAARSQSFEGTVRQRIAVLADSQLAAFAGTAPGERPDPAALFGTAVDRLPTGSSGPALELIISLKGSHMRMEMPELPAIPGADPQTVSRQRKVMALMGDAYVLFDGSTHEITSVLPGPRMTMTLNMDSIPQALPDSVLQKLRADSAVVPTFREIGPATVNGLETTEYEATWGEAVARVWIVTGFAGLGEAMGLIARSRMTGMGLPTTDLTGMPKGGYAVRTMTLMKLPQLAASPRATWMFLWADAFPEEKPLDDALFQVPSDYRTVKLPGQR